MLANVRSAALLGLVFMAIVVCGPSVAKAQSTIVNALIGVAVAMTAIAFISFLGSRLT